jgi:membrane protease YdiL (CAAX protease family)
VVSALALLLLGTLAAVSVSALASDEETRPLVSAPLLALVAFAAARTLGAGAVRASLARGASSAAIAAGFAGGLVGFALSWAYVHALLAWAGVAPEVPEFGIAQVLGVVVLVPLAEEWLCRGVLWVALRRVLTVRWTTLVSAVLFALLHGLGGAGLFEYPHRFAIGVLLGVLRARSGSLVPGIVAHAVINALALVPALA